MNRKRTLTAGLALLVIAAFGFAAYLLKVGGGPDNQLLTLREEDGCATADAAPLGQPLAGSDDRQPIQPGEAGRTDNQGQELGETIEEDNESMGYGKLETPTGSAPQGDNAGATGQPAPTAGTPAVAPSNAAQAPAAPLGIPASARDPTPRERAARSRYSGGELPDVAALPAKAATASELQPLDMSKLAEPEVWAEYWSREGYAAPAMVKTPVRGKVMNLLTNREVPEASVRVFTFFPADSPSGPILPVMMEAATNEQGFFSINLPAPRDWPENYPRYAISIEHEGKRLADCAAYDNLRSGEHNEIGVFWAPEEPFTLAVSAVVPGQGLAVVSTGRIDPRRWDRRRAKAIFPNFGPQPLAASGATLAGTWDFLGDPPFVTLLSSGELVLTRQCTRSAEEQVRHKLGTTTLSLFVEECTLDEVLAKFRDEREIDVQRTEAVNGETPVSLDVGRVTIRQALDLVADYADLSWRIEGSTVIVDEPGKAPAPDLRHPFLSIEFPNDGNLALAGVVVDGEGAPIAGAQLSAQVHNEPRLAYSDTNGYFEFFGLPDAAIRVDVTHSLYVGRDQELQTGTLDARIELPFRRPRIALNVVADATDAPIAEIWINGTQVTSPYAQSPKGGPLPARHETSQTGSYLFTHEKRVTFLTIQAPGFKPHTLEWVDESGTFDIRLQAGLVLERRPRDYDAVENEGLWGRDEGDGPGLWSLDDDHWVEYRFDFGETPGRFDLLLGVTNHTYGTLPLDNEYLFEVSVYLDGKTLGMVKIESDPEVPQFARVQLGNFDEDEVLQRNLTGEHTIRLLWRNDRYIPGQLDANIRYASIRLMEVP